MAKSSKKRERGASLVEALIVISSFILLLLAMNFFKDMYVKQTRTARLARATVMAFSMQGCPDGQAPAAWAGTDLGKMNKNGQTNNTTVLPPGTEKPDSKRANAILDGIPGGGALNPIADLRLTLEASSTTKMKKLGSREGFTSTMGSTSYVGCGEGIRDDSFKSIMGYVLDKFHLSKDSCDPKTDVSCGDDKAPPP